MKTLNLEPGAMEVVVNSFCVYSSMDRVFDSDSKDVGSIPTRHAIFADLCEWLKQPSWKGGVRQKRTTGSNPVVSAIFKHLGAFYYFSGV